MSFSPLVPPLYEATVTDWLRHDLLRKAGLAPCTLDEIKIAVAAKRDPHFDDARNARLAMGHLRYAQGGRNFTDCIKSIITRAEEYRKTGNREHLVDIANLAEIEWVWPTQDGTHWEAQDCGGHWSLRNQ